ncbi:sulfite exporter TauE/SafE family protein [Desulfallas sp. Bu1-1]|uniref:cytochrome c biogenesis CcdA family protein n=1 Tax=Desulfallas sp. Bu1-1 TaxID=2787620 RepID=UPI00189C9757|nr:cytochrome c biogenesis protein CcdA [Desulfallas sp. Bu1-1]MBF7084279.1 sulfite exporter TauE/SafE family protein [Desulfallas sp. Bu1-1]
MINLAADSITLLAGILVFAGGLASGLSPCTLPTVVFVASYVGGYAEKSKLRGFALALAFVLGLSLTLAAMGAVAALAGSLFMESDVLWYVPAFVLLLMGLNLLGLFNLPDLPGFNLKSTGTRGFLGAFLLGIPFAFAASPCTTPVTAGVLAYAAGKGSAFYGFTLLVYALGRSLPLLIVGTFTGLVKKVGRLQVWRDILQRISGVILLLLGLWFLWDKILH